MCDTFHQAFPRGCVCVCVYMCVCVCRRDNSDWRHNELLRDSQTVKGQLQLCEMPTGSAAVVFPRVMMNATFREADGHFVSCIQCCSGPTVNLSHRSWKKNTLCYKQ